jgi:hypothetical protein
MREVSISLISILDDDDKKAGTGPNVPAFLMGIDRVRRDRAYYHCSSHGIHQGSRRVGHVGAAGPFPLPKCTQRGPRGVIMIVRQLNRVHSLFFWVRRKGWADIPTFCDRKRMGTPHPFCYNGHALISIGGHKLDCTPPANSSPTF